MILASLWHYGTNNIVYCMPRSFLVQCQGRKGHHSREREKRLAYGRKYYWHHPAYPMTLVYFFFNQIVYMTVEGALKEARAEIEGPEKNTILFIPNVIPIIFSRSISRIIQIIEEWKRQNDFYAIIFFNINISFFISPGRHL